METENNTNPLSADEQWSKDYSDLQNRNIKLIEQIKDYKGFILACRFSMQESIRNDAQRLLSKYNSITK